MLDILNTINWESLTFHKHSPTKIPDLIRQFHNATSQEEFELHFKEFTEIVHPMGLIVAATLPSARVLIHLLKNTDDMHRKIRYSNCLLSFVASTQHRQRYLPKFHHRYIQPTSINNYRTSLEVYDAVAEGFDTFMDFLKGDDPYLCILNMNILVLLPHNFDEFMPALIECIENSQNEWVQTIGAWIFAKLVDYDTRHLISEEEASEKLLFWAEYGDSLRFCTSAAYGRLLKQSTSANADPLPNTVVDLIAQSLNIDVLNTTLSFPNAERRHIFRRNVPFNSYVVRRLIYQKKTIWTTILQRSQLNPTQAHLYYRELLNTVFTRQDFHAKSNYWGNPTVFEDKIFNKIIYIQHRHKGKYDPDRNLLERQKSVLQAIIDCEPFWEIPSNLFSFYYGLPDERDELRKLVD